MNFILTKSPELALPPPDSRKSRTMIADIFRDVGQRDISDAALNAMQDALRGAMQAEPFARAYPRLPSAPPGVITEDPDDNSKRGKLRGHITRTKAHAELAKHPAGLTINELAQAVGISSKPLRLHIKALMDCGAIKPAGTRNGCGVFAAASAPVAVPDMPANRFDVRLPAVIAAMAGRRVMAADIVKATSIPIDAVRECLLVLYRTGRADRVRVSGSYAYTATEAAKGPSRLSAIQDSAEQTCPSGGAISGAGE